MVRHRIPSTSGNESRSQDRDPRGLHSKKNKKNNSDWVFYVKLVVVPLIGLLIGYYAYQGNLELQENL